MNQKKYFPAFIGFILLLALFLRLPALDLRPMHGDEAVNAVKFGTLLEHGTYDYDPSEYHGPTLYFFTLFSTFPRSIISFSDLNESDLRIITVLSGFFLLCAFILLRKEISQPVLLLTLLFLTLSPANVFYNRYYIHETLLVFFNVGLMISLYRYLKYKTYPALLLSGLFLGLMISTKETWLIYFAAILCGYMVSPGLKRISAAPKLKPLLIFSGSCLLICVIFYSSFMQNPVGLIDALISYKNYFAKAATNMQHIHSWEYYLSLLLFFKNSPSQFWTEGLLVLSSMTGIFFAFREKEGFSREQKILRFTAVYTISLVFLFSSIPYKTPWNLLGFLPGMALLAGFGMIRLYRLILKPGWRIIFIMVVSLAFCHLSWQSLRLNFTYPADPINPYVYAHPLPDVFEIERQTRKIAEHHPLGFHLPIQIVAGGSDYWPLPWYFRRYTKIGWWSELPAAGELAPLIILNADLEPGLIDKLYNQRPPGQRDLYVPLFDHDIFLRPGVEFRAYLKKSDWDLAHKMNEDLLMK